MESVISEVRYGYNKETLLVTYLYLAHIVAMINSRKYLDEWPPVPSAGAIPTGEKPIPGKGFRERSYSPFFQVKLRDYTSKHVPYGLNETNTRFILELMDILREREPLGNLTRVGWRHYRAHLQKAKDLQSIYDDLANNNERVPSDWKKWGPDVLSKIFKVVMAHDGNEIKNLIKSQAKSMEYREWSLEDFTTGETDPLKWKLRIKKEHEQWLCSECGEGLLLPGEGDDELRPIRENRFGTCEICGNRVRYSAFLNHHNKWVSGPVVCERCPIPPEIAWIMGKEDKTSCVKMKVTHYTTDTLRSYYARPGWGYCLNHENSKVARPDNEYYKSDLREAATLREKKKTEAKYHWIFDNDESAFKPGKDLTGLDEIPDIEPEALSADDSSVPDNDDERLGSPPPDTTRPWTIKDFLELIATQGFRRDKQRNLVNLAVFYANHGIAKSPMRALGLSRTTVWQNKLVLGGLLEQALPDTDFTFLSAPSRPKEPTPQSIASDLVDAAMDNESGNHYSPARTAPGGELYYPRKWNFPYIVTALAIGELHKPLPTSITLGREDLHPCPGCGSYTHKKKCYKCTPYIFKRRDYDLGCLPNIYKGREMKKKGTSRNIEVGPYMTPCFKCSRLATYYVLVSGKVESICPDCTFQPR